MFASKELNCVALGKCGVITIVLDVNRVVVQVCDVHFKSKLQHKTRQTGHDSMPDAYYFLRNFEPQMILLIVVTSEKAHQQTRRILFFIKS